LSKYIHKSHDVSVLIYHFVCPAKYRKVIFNKEVDETLKGIYLEISKRYEISFLEVGTDRDHVHFLIQSVPKYSVTEIIRMIKSITAKKIFEKHGFFVNTVSKFGSEDTISKYVRKQGIEKEYKKLHYQQISLF